MPRLLRMKILLGHRWTLRFVDMNIKRLKAEDRRFRERMKTEASDVSELMARSAQPSFLTTICNDVHVFRTRRKLAVSHP